MVDTITYVAVLAHLAIAHPDPANALLLAMLLYRTVGIAEYVRTQDDRTFVRYPDVFREFSLLLALMHDGWVRRTPWTLVGSAVGASAFKVVYEAVHHAPTTWNT